MSIRENILSAKTRRFEMFKSSFWKDEVKVESVSEGRRRAIVKECTVDVLRFNPESEKNEMVPELDYAKYCPALIIACFKDPLTGAQIFERTDAEAISELDVQAVEEAINVCMRVCGFGGTKAETEKNSVKTDAATSASV